MKPYAPHPYQEEAIAFLLGQPTGGLFLDPGYGKTSIVLAMLTVLKKTGHNNRALIVAPVRVAREVWPAERAKWFDFHHLSVSVLHGPRKDAALREAIDSKPDILLVSYDALPWVVANDVARKTDRDVLICDESTFAKGHDTRRFKMLRGIVPHFGRRVILTGTPIPNGYMDLWSQIYLLDQGAALGKFITHYRNQYFNNVSHMHFPEYRLAWGADRFINERIKPLVFRGDAPEVRTKMPAVTYNQIPVQLPEQTLKLYAELRKEFYLAMQGHEIMPPHAAALSMKLRQVANGVALSDDNPKAPVVFHDAKIDALREVVEELNGNPLLVFYEFQADRDRICAALSAPYIGGGTSPAEAGELIAQFNKGIIPVMCVHPLSGGFGLNLQEACHNILWFGPTWNAGYWDQGNARVYRQGQTRPVMIHTIVGDGTDDAVVSVALETKLNVQRALLDAVKNEEGE